MQTLVDYCHSGGLNQFILQMITLTHQNSDLLILTFYIPYIFDVLYTVYRLSAFAFPVYYSSASASTAPEKKE